MKNKELSPHQAQSLLAVLQKRFEQNMARHKGITWANVAAKLEKSPAKLWSLDQMEETGGEPDVVAYEKGQYLFVDCAAESPKGRRSLCYDKKAWDSDKKYDSRNQHQCGCQQI